MKTRCQHLGKIASKGTRNGEPLVVHQCAARERCTLTDCGLTLAKTGEPMPVCETCDQYEAAPMVQLTVPRQTRATADSLPCSHRGEVIRQDTSNICGSVGDQINVFGCAVHGECAVGKYCTQQTVRACIGCEDRREPAEPVAPRIELGPNPARVEHGEGRGIVIPGGGIYLKSAWVTIRMVRHFGCELPIELWLLPWETVTAAERSAIEAYGVTVRTLDPGYCVDEKIAAKAWRKPIYLGGWQSKIQAVLQSSFREVIYLDADCYPVEAGWLDKLTETGEATFLGDIVESNVLLTDAACEAFRVPHGVPVDSGAFYVSKDSTAWCDIVAAINGPEMVRHVYGDILYGDKDSWWIAHHLAGVPYRILPRGKTLAGGTGIRHVCGLIHRTGCKFTDGRSPNTPQQGQHTIEGDRITAPILRGWPPLEVSGARDAELVRGVIELDEYRLDKTGPTSLIVDAGGHIGSFSVAALRRWTAARIIAIEPDAENCELFRRNVISSNVTLVEAALGEEGGTVGLTSAPGDTAYQTTATGTIPRVPLSSLVTEAGWDRIDLLKIDIEGDECLVISDLIEAGWIRNVGRIVGEWHTPAIREELVELLRPTHHLTVCSHRWEHGYFEADRNDQP